MIDPIPVLIVGLAWMAVTILMVYWFMGKL